MKKYVLMILIILLMIIIILHHLFTIDRIALFKTNKIEDTIIKSRLNNCFGSNVLSSAYWDCDFNLYLLKRNNMDLYKKRLKELYNRIKIYYKKDVLDSLQDNNLDNQRYYNEAYVNYKDRINNEVYSFSRVSVNHYANGKYDFYLQFIWKKVDKKWYIDKNHPMIKKNSYLFCHDNKSIKFTCVKYKGKANSRCVSNACDVLLDNEMIRSK